MFQYDFLRCRQSRRRAIAQLKLQKSLGSSMLIHKLAIFIQTVYPLQANTNAIDAYKIYAHIKVGSYKEFVCLEKLWTKESNWRYKAKNKQLVAAYGIPQLLKMKETNPYKQIDLGLRYIDKRYEGNACVAWQHWRSKGWY
jgi:hypothetical protein